MKEPMADEQACRKVRRRNDTSLTLSFIFRFAKYHPPNAAPPMETM